MKSTAHETDESPVQSQSPHKWVQLGPLAIETLLLIILSIVLGALCLEQSVLQLLTASCKNVPLLVAFMAIFGAYREIGTTNAVSLFNSYLPSFLMAGSVFLLSVKWLANPVTDFRFEAFFLLVAFFMLNSARPLILDCNERVLQTGIK